MRILHISSAKTFGGGERHVVDLARGLIERGHEVFVALRPTSEWHDQVAFVPEERVLKVSIRNSFGMFSAKRIARFVQANDIDVVHAHVARDYLAASAAVRIAKTPKLILTRHVMFPMKPFHRFALRNVDRAIAVSPAVRDQLIRIFPEGKVNVIANGIAMTGINRDALGHEFRELHSIPPEAPLIITLGELKVLKGQRDFVLAANEVVKSVPDAHFVIAGRDNSLDKGFRRELKRLVRVFGIEVNFTWLDWLDDTRPLLAAADLFVSPSHSESFGLAMLEAMAAGAPVLATETHGARELVNDHALLTQIKDPLALGEKLVALLGDPAGLRLAGDVLQKRATELYGVERMVAETEELYRQVSRK